MPDAVSDARNDDSLDTSCVDLAADIAFMPYKVFIA